MLGEIIKKEIREIITSAKFIVTFVLCAILVLLSVVMGISNYNADQREHDRAVALNKQGLESRHSIFEVAEFGTKVYKRPQVLGTIVNGVEADAGRGMKVGPGTDPEAVDFKYLGNLVLAVFGNLDLAFIVRVVLSLLAILFTYDALTGEKEKGTLRLIFSNAVPRDVLILGKATGGFLCLLVSLIVPFVLALLILIAYPTISLAGDDWVRLAMIFAVFLLYISVFFMLGLFVSARTHRSTTSFLVLLFIWVTFVMIFPKISVMAAAQLKPIPSANEMRVKKDQFLQALYRESQAKFQAYVESHPNPRGKEGLKAWQQQCMNVWEDLSKARDKKNEEFIASADRDYQLRKQNQDRLALDLSCISPAGAMMFASMSIARTGLREQQRYLESVRSYWLVWGKWSIVKEREGPTTLPPGTKVDLSEVPQFEYQPEQTASSIKPALPDFAILIFMIVLFFAGAYWSFVRYDVR
jgi:ABC-type transport system involved in multi-copper enzyme maturation permease subunit